MKTDEKWMELAIAEARKCPEGVPKVGAVIIKNNHLIGSGYRAKDNTNIHAEHSAIEDALSKGFKLKGSTVYTTLEPCSVLSGERCPCAQRLIDSKVKEVFIGSYDRNPSMYRKGWRAMKNAGIILKDFSSDTS
jgi:diaminohydroxyphosphoribosylaminopyrimidine deaminase/5-amino-6-(5-phosphoribosylamino)uracil reductase